MTFSHSWKRKPPTYPSAGYTQTMSNHWRHQPAGSSWQWLVHGSQPPVIQMQHWVFFHLFLCAILLWGMHEAFFACVPGRAIGKSVFSPEFHWKKRWILWFSNAPKLIDMYQRNIKSVWCSRKSCSLDVSAKMKFCDVLVGVGWTCTWTLISPPHPTPSPPTSSWRIR